MWLEFTQTGYPVVNLYNSQPLGRDNCIATKTVVLDYSKDYSKKFYDVSRLASRFARKNVFSYDDAYTTQFEERGKRRGCHAES